MKSAPWKVKNPGSPPHPQRQARIVAHPRSVLDKSGGSHRYACRTNPARFANELFRPCIIRYRDGGVLVLLGHTSISLPDPGKPHLEGACNNAGNPALPWPDSYITALRDRDEKSTRQPPFALQKPTDSSTRLGMTFELEDVEALGHRSWGAAFDIFSFGSCLTRRRL